MHVSTRPRNRREKKMFALISYYFVSHLGPRLGFCALRYINVRASINYPHCDSAPSDITFRFLRFFAYGSVTSLISLNQRLNRIARKKKPLTIRQKCKEYIKIRRWDSGKMFSKYVQKKTALRSAILKIYTKNNPSVL